MAIIDRGPNTHLLRIFIGRDANGKRQYVNKTVHGTISQAKQEHTKMMREKDTESLVKPSKRSVQEYLESWVKTKANIEVKTRMDYEALIKLNLVPFIGGLQLSQLSPEHIRVLYGKLQHTRKLSPRSIRYTHTILKQALSVAVEDGILVRNPCDRKSVQEALPKMQKAKPSFLTHEQSAQVVDGETDVQLKALWRLLLVSAMRPQEALVLKWDDVADGKVTIARTISCIEKGVEIVKDYGKTEGSMRTIALDGATVELLQAHRKVQAEVILKAGGKYTRHGYIFTTRTGSFIGRSNARVYWSRALLRAGLPDIKLYSTRHTRASLGIANGEDIKSVSELLGHKDPAMTLRVYTHTLPGQGRKNADSFAASLLQKNA